MQSSSFVSPDNLADHLPADVVDALDAIANGYLDQFVRAGFVVVGPLERIARELAIETGRTATVLACIQSALEDPDISRATTSATRAAALLADLPSVRPIIRRAAELEADPARSSVLFDILRVAEPRRAVLRTDPNLN